MAVTVGTAAGVNWSAAEGALVPLGAVTVMPTVPADPAGEVTASWVGLFTA